MKTTSGSPATWSAKRKAYKAQSGPVSNPGHPSKVNRKARRLREAMKRNPNLADDGHTYTDETRIL